jgi:hypothetical protein
MKVSVENVLSGELLEAAWRLYNEAFGELRAVAVQRHLMYRGEFDDVMTDERVQKYLSITSEGVLAGLATLTNDLDAVPLISPDYFAHRWPEQYAQRQIWYQGFVAIDATQRSTGVFEALIDSMWQVVRIKGGIAALDLCARNEKRRLDAAITRTLTALTPDVIATRLDTQAFWAWELPAAA